MKQLTIGDVLKYRALGEGDGTGYVQYIDNGSGVIFADVYNRGIIIDKIFAYSIDEFNEKISGVDKNST